MARSLFWLLPAIALLLGSAPATAADVELVPAPPRAVVVSEPPPVIAGPPIVVGAPPPVAAVPPPVTGPLLPPPKVRYGCERVWRCDTTICEWRRGCWGVYGYVETPYYTSAFARRQWEAHGLPGSRDDRRGYK